MIKIRLKRLGRKRVPFYRVVVMDVRQRRQGAPLEELGHYNPHTKELKLNKVAALSWIEKGAIPSDTAKRLIDHAPESGELITIEKEKKEQLSKKAKAKQADEEKAKIEAAEAKKAEAEAKKAEAETAKEEPKAEAEAPKEEATAE